MRIRTGLGPDDWTANEPASATSPSHRAFAVIPAVNVGSMKPILTGSVLSMQSIRRDEKRLDQMREASRRYRARAK